MNGLVSSTHRSIARHWDISTSKPLATGPRTVARLIASVSSWYRFLVDEEVRLLSPVQHVRRPRGSTQLVR